MSDVSRRRALLVGVFGTLATLPLARAEEASPACPPLAQGRSRQAPMLDMGLRFELEPKALGILKAASARLAAAKTLQFTAVATYESPARTGQPLAYTTISEVTLQRPDKLRVITPADGPPSEFYYDGKVVMAYAAEANLVAVAQAPPTIDEMLRAAYDITATYFPFTDLIVSDPYKEIADGLKLAFFVGQSKVVGGTTTDIVVVANDAVQAQIWIGTQDKLPRMVRATYFDEPGNYRHLVEFSKWRLDGPVADGAFTSARAAAAPRMQFGAPMPPPAPSDQTGASKP